MAVNPIRLLRNIITGQRPPSSKLDGEPYYNLADMQFGIMSGGVANDFIGVPIFSTTAAYPINKTVQYQGMLYVSNTAISPGPWNPAQWGAAALTSQVDDLRARIEALEHEVGRQS